MLMALFPACVSSEHYPLVEDCVGQELAGLQC